MTRGRRQALVRLLTRSAILVLALLVLVWMLTPGLRAFTLVANFSHRSAPPAPTDLPVQNVHFQATDGVQLAGWFVIRAPTAPTIILVHGFKGARADMLSWARFLVAAGYNILLSDSRGCGESAGWAITLGAREPEDILGAVAYLQQRADLQAKRYGALGVSLGAGAVILAAARAPALVATVADSAWADERGQLNRMGRLAHPPLTLPLLPYEPALVDALIGAQLADTRPLAVIGQIAPRAVLLIHSADDQNTTTPLSGERQLYAAAGQPKAQWIAPSGGHAGALQAHPAEYEQQVLAFCARYLRPPPRTPSNRKHGNGSRGMRGAGSGPARSKPLGQVKPEAEGRSRKRLWQRGDQVLERCQAISTLQVLSAPPAHDGSLGY